LIGGGVDGVGLVGDRLGGDGRGGFGLADPRRAESCGALKKIAAEFGMINLSEKGHAYENSGSSRVFLDLS